MGRGLLTAAALALAAGVASCGGNHSTVIQGFTVPDSSQPSPQVASRFLLCVVRHPGDNPVCGGVIYPGKRPGCGFGFNFSRAQAVVVRVHKSDGLTDLEPLQLDGHGPSC